VRHIPGVGHNLHDHSWFSASWRCEFSVMCYRMERILRIYSSK
jgi:hypothetical protein